MNNNIGLSKSFSLEAIEIVYAQKKDLPTIEWEGEFTKYRKIYNDVYQKSLINKSIMWLAKTMSGDMVGQAFVQLPAENKDPVYLHAFRVKKMYRSLGIGSMLLNRAEKEALGLGYKLINLNVSFANRKAFKLYIKNGYRVFGITPEYWQYYDENNVLRRVREPSWRLKKKLRRKLFKN